MRLDLVGSQGDCNRPCPTPGLYDGFTFYFLLRPPLRPASLGLALASARSGVVGRPLLFWLFFPLFSLVSRHSGARWDLPMYIGSSPIANYLQHKRSFSSPWSLSETKNLYKSAVGFEQLLRHTSLVSERGSGASVTLQAYRKEQRHGESYGADSGPQ